VREVRAQTTDYDKMYEEQVTQNPTYSPFMNALKSDFPEDYGKLKSQAIAMLREGKSREALQSMSFVFMRNWLSRTAIYLAQAPSPMLREYFMRSTALMKLMQSESDNLCARYATEGLSPLDKLSPDVKTAMANLTGLKIKASKAGVTNPANRPTQVNNSEWSELAGKLPARGLSEAQMNILAGTQLSSASDKDKCEIAIAFNEGIDDLPSQLADKIRANLAISSVETK